MTEPECYERLYGELMLYVPHYKNRSIFTIPSGITKVSLTLIGAGGGGNDGGEGGTNTPLKET